MHVIKRNGVKQQISFDKILHRIKRIGQEVNIKINYSALVMKIIDQLYDNIETTKIDELMAEQCASQTTIHTDYGILASRLIISNFHKNTSSEFSHVMKELYEFNDIHGQHYPIISKDLYNIIVEHGDELDSWIVHDRGLFI